jgi:ketosteroid isomerase-like protein
MRTLTIAVAVALLVSTAASAADRADEVREAERGFAKAFADRDAARFAAFISDDATFLGASRALVGKAEIMRVWSEYLKAKDAPFSWYPDRVAVNGAGDLGLTWGPVFDAKGKHILNFQSVWQRQGDGSWKVLFDGPGERVCEGESK